MGRGGAGRGQGRKPPLVPKVEFRIKVTVEEKVMLNFCLERMRKEKVSIDRFVKEVEERSVEF